MLSGALPRWCSPLEKLLGKEAGITTCKSSGERKRAPLRPVQRPNVVFPGCHPKAGDRARVGELWSAPASPANHEPCPPLAWPRPVRWLRLAALGARAVGAVQSASARYGQASQSRGSPAVGLRPRGEVTVLRALSWLCVRSVSAVSMADKGTELSLWCWVERQACGCLNI